MRIELRLLEEPYHFEAVNEDGAVAHFDASPDIGGLNKGMRPMQMVLAALGGCSGIDVLSILRKQRERVEDFHVSIEAEREPGVTPSLFRTIHLRFRLSGDLNAAKVEHAVALSMDKYCSVARLLQPTAAISRSIEIIPGSNEATAPTPPPASAYKA